MGRVALASFDRIRLSIMKQYIVTFLTGFHSKKSSWIYKVISLLFGMLFFLVLFPAVSIYLGFLIKNIIHIGFDGTAEFVISIASLIVGLFFLIWTTIFQWKIGKGVPTPNAPTQHLVTTGPYKLCRNPIELGAIFYYFGIGTIIGGITVGIICFLFVVIIGSAYHKFIEEAELEIRFGDEYKQYKKRTPFLMPILRKREKQ
jgi:protein-S-isoprenylcysteine O-methyltransferase Ste14